MKSISDPPLRPRIHTGRHSLSGHKGTLPGHPQACATLSPSHHVKSLGVSGTPDSVQVLTWHEAPQPHSNNAKSFPSESRGEVLGLRQQGNRSARGPLTPHSAGRNGGLGAGGLPSPANRVGWVEERGSSRCGSWRFQLALIFLQHGRREQGQGAQSRGGETLRLG